MNYTFIGGSTHGSFVPGNIYHRLAGYIHGTSGVSNGFYIDDTNRVRLLKDSLFTATRDRKSLVVPDVTYDLHALAERWGISTTKANHWDQPFRMYDAVRGAVKKANNKTLTRSELVGMAVERGYYLSELSVRWGWHYNGDTLVAIAADPQRVSLIWDLFNGVE